MTKVKGFELHHWSYNQEDWLDIVQLTIQEHNRLHRYIKYDDETMKYKTLNGVLLDTKEKHLVYYQSLPF